jgi:hypothetical protein
MKSGIKHDIRNSLTCQEFSYSFHTEHNIHVYIPYIVYWKIMQNKAIQTSIHFHYMLSELH